MYARRSSTLTIILAFLFLLLQQTVAGRPCTDPYFALTAANYQESGAGEFYAKWTADSFKKPEFAELGETRFFLHDQLGLTDFECGIARMGCTNLPSCDKIKEFAWDDSHARLVFFVTRIMENVNTFGGLMYRTTTNAQIDTSNVIPAAAATFFWQTDLKNAKLCKYLTQAAKDTIAFSIAVTFAVFPPLMMPALPAGAAAGATFLAAEAAIPWGVLAANVMKSPWVSNGVMMFPNSYIGAGVDKGCNRFLPVAKDQRLEHIGQLSVYLRDMQMTYRSEISTAMAALNRGLGFGEKGIIVDGKTAMGDLVSRGAYFLVNKAQRDMVLQDPFKLESAFAQRVTNGVISACLATSQCYLSCQEGLINGKRACNADGPLAKSRYCPAPDTACQAQCWRPSQKAKNVEVYGLKALETPLWNVKIQDMFAGSYANYAADPALAMSKSGALAKFDAAELLANPLENPATAFRIPVCQSALEQFGDFSKHGSKNNGLFPCSCGDVYSSETAKFLEAAVFTAKTHKKELVKVCPKQLDSVNLAVEHYLALCSLGVHWPLKEDPRTIQTGLDPRCKKIAEDVRALVAKGVNRVDVNRWFCTKSVEGLQLRALERHFVAVPHMRGHDDRCKQFLKKTAGQ